MTRLTLLAAAILIALVFLVTWLTVTDTMPW